LLVEVVDLDILEMVGMEVLVEVVVVQQLMGILD
jgi:hypothetical protein